MPLRQAQGGLARQPADPSTPLRAGFRRLLWFFGGFSAGSGLHLLANLAIFAGKEQQRGAFAHDEFFDFRDKNRVVAGVLRGVQAAFEIRQRAAQYGRAVFRALEFCARFFCRAIVRTRRASVVLGNCALGFGEDVHSEALLGVQVGVGTSFLIDADQHQHGVERDRGEGVGGHAVDFAFGVQGDNSDAGGEASEGLAEVCLADTHKRVAAGEKQPRRPDTLPRASSSKSEEGEPNAAVIVRESGHFL